MRCKFSDMPEQTLVPADFGARVRASRAYAGDMTQADLAERIGMSGGYVKMLEAGKGVKDVEALGLLDALPKATGLPREFFTGAEPEPEPAAEMLERIAATLDRLLNAQAALQKQTEQRYANLEKRLGKVDPDVADEAIRVLAEARMRLGRDIGKRYLSDARATDRPGELKADAQ